MGLSATLEVSKDALGEGGDGTSSEILDVLKDIRNELSKNTKLQQTGFINGFGGMGGGAIAGLLRGLGGSALGLAAVAPLLIGAQSGPGNVKDGKVIGYEQGTDPNTGKQMYFEIDQKTGEILRVLTEQQARDEGILDDKKQIHNTLKNQNKKWDEITKGMASYKDSVMLTLNNVEQIEKLAANNANLWVIINNALAAQAASLGVSKRKTDKYRTQYVAPDGTVVGTEDELTQTSYYGDTAPPGSMNYTPAAMPIASYMPQRTAESNQTASYERTLRNNVPLVDPTAYTPVGR